MKILNQFDFQNIRSAQESDALSLALLHKKTLKSSYLSRLGTDFLETLYLFLIKNEIIFVYTEEQIIIGFVSFSTNSSQMMKTFLLTSPRCIFILMKLMFKSPSIAPRLIETYFAPFKLKSYYLNAIKAVLPNSELLSISVEPEYQAKGIGNQLLNELEKYLNSNQMFKYKVVAGVDLNGANKFYLKNGFKLATMINIHGDNLSNVYTKEL